MYVYVYVCVYIYIYMYICTCMCIYIHIHVYIYIYVYMYMYVYIYIYIYTYIYIHTRVTLVSLSYMRVVQTSAPYFHSAKYEARHSGVEYQKFEELTAGRRGWYSSGSVLCLILSMLRCIPSASSNMLHHVSPWLWARILPHLLLLLLLLLMIMIITIIIKHKQITTVIMI